MHSREQYLARVREEYGEASLLNEAIKRTRLNRKVLIGKLAHPGEAYMCRDVPCNTSTFPSMT